MDQSVIETLRNGRRELVERIELEQFDELDIGLDIFGATVEALLWEAARQADRSATAVAAKQINELRAKILDLES